MSFHVLASGSEVSEQEVWMSKSLLIFALSMLLFGCASPAPLVHAVPGLNDSNSGEIHVFKNDYLGFAAELRVFIDGNYVGAINREPIVTARVAPGEHLVEIMAYSMGILGGNDSEFRTSVDVGDDIYLRTFTATGIESNGQWVFFGYPKNFLVSSSKEEWESGE
jgi:hypothetical protein|tara:strand:+ start:1167 stop:1661 length:495 start_codon:yes stop_codon:yes gene_type:complete